VQNSQLSQAQPGRKICSIEKFSSRSANTIVGGKGVVGGVYLFLFFHLREETREWEAEVREKKKRNACRRGKMAVAEPM